MKERSTQNVLHETWTDSLYNGPMWQVHKLHLPNAFSASLSTTLAVAFIAPQAKLQHGAVQPILWLYISLSFKCSLHKKKMFQGNLVT